MKICWCQQNSRVTRFSNLYIIFDLILVRYNCVKFHNCRIYVTNSFETPSHFRSPFFCPPHPWAPLKIPILSSVKWNKTFFFIQKCCPSAYLVLSVYFTNFKGDSHLTYFFAPENNIMSIAAYISPERNNNKWLS